MAEAVKTKVRLDSPKENKTTLRSHLEHIYKQTGKKVGELAREREIPLALLYLWNWFWDLRASCGFEATYMKYSEILAWEQLTGIKLHQWELDVMKAMDRAFVEVKYELI